MLIEALYDLLYRFVPEEVIEPEEEDGTPIEALAVTLPQVLCNAHDLVPAG